MSAAVRLATGPVSWGVDFADAPANPPWRRVLDEIPKSGLRALECGPVGYLPEDPGQLRKQLVDRGLTAVGSFVFEDLHEPSAHREIQAVAERACRAITAAEGRVLVIIDRVSEQRSATFARPEEARRLEQARWRQMLDCARRVAEIAHEHGLIPAFHPHAGSYVEFTDEVGRLLQDTDLGICFDTGHAALAGMDVRSGLAMFRDRLTHIHLKDVDGDVLERARTRKMSFWEAIAADVFCPIGAGVVDFSTLAAELDAAGYEGFATIEQDRVPGSGSPLADISSSLAVLERAGFDSAATALRQAASH